jgi:hypothetical protein
VHGELLASRQAGSVCDAGPHALEPLGIPRLPDSTQAAGLGPAFVAAGVACSQAGRAPPVVGALNLMGARCLPHG